ncbi:PIN domain-containing protein [Mucilaginibacter pedocola]|uniref:PIN domain-containing protein n=1 Tax=Mucilaginibacter pedocola TaxID=1792845 RepID=A0A1S9PFU5_9SPHI|nr:hypothetical protein [Mucilaginibacter pedocola]OOQ59831.1 hypothetical protein BC343_06710 [Mucilaginibacter pedocola]
MSLLSVTTFASIADFIVKNTETYFFKKGLDATLAAMEKDYKNELRKAISHALTKYEAQYPQPGVGKKFPFYHSQRIINELISLGIMDQDYDIQELLDALDTEPNVITPTRKNIEDFLSIFKAEVEAITGLEKLAIKANYQEEIFLISRKLAAIESKLEHAFDEYSADLEMQWKNRLDTYVATLKAFKPETALKLLDALVESFKESTKQPQQKLLGAIWFQRGACLKILNRAEESHKAYVKAYGYDRDSPHTREQAAFAYYKLGEPAKAEALGKQLLDEDGYNPVGWVIKCLLATGQDLIRMVGEVPAIVRKDLSFRIPLQNVINMERDEERMAQLFVAGVNPGYKDYVAEEITINNIGRQGYWINIFFHDYFKNLFFDFNTAQNESKTALVVMLNDLLKRFLDVLARSEMKDEQSNLKFMLAFTNYLLEGRNEYALEMKTWHDQLKRRTGHFTLLCANVLQIAGFIEEAIALLEGIDPKGYECYQLLSFCYLKKGDPDGYAKTVKDICGNLAKVSPYLTPVFANHIVELKQFNQTAGFTVADFTEGKVFEQEADEHLVRNIAITILEGEQADSTAALLSLADAYTDDKLLALIAITLHFGGKDDEAVKVFRKYIDKIIDKEGRDLYHYIQALYNTKKDSQELLQVLENWRLNSSFDPGITRLELQAYSELTNWDKIMEIGEFYLEQNPDDELVTGRYLYALYELGTPEALQKISGLAGKLKETQFQSAEIAGNVAQILIKTKHFMEGFDILYRYASDPGEKNLRMMYFISFAEYRDEYEAIWPAKEYDTVEAGHFVKYSINRDIKYIELNEQNLKQAPFNEFPGCGKGGAFPVKRPLSGQEDMITIERIMNKYLYLHDLIVDEVSGNPYSGIPMESMEIEPGDITSIEKVLTRFMGERGSQEQEIKTRLIEQYENREISFSQVVVAALQGKYLPGYFEMARRLRGINIVPLIAFRPVPASRYLLDLSSLPLLYQMVNQHKVEFGVPFVLAKHHADHIKHLLAEAKADDREQLSLMVTREGVTPNFVPEEARKSNITYLEGLSAWVNDHCEIRLSARVLDFIRQAKATGARRDLVDYLVNTTVIMEDDQELMLISDDAIFYTLGLPQHRITSTEYFAKRILPAGSPALDEFITNQYRGYTPSLSQVNEQYTQKLAGKPHRYELCLENLSLNLNPYNVTTGVLHARWLVLSNLLNEAELKMAVTAVFTGMLKAVSLPGIKDFVRLIVREQFKLLGARREFVLGCLNDAISETGI